MKKFYLLLFAIGFQTLLFAQKFNNINKAPGDTLYYEDFANQIPSGWRVVNLAANNNNWIWSNTAPGGQYSTQIGTLNSPTASNGYLCLPADLYNTPYPVGGPVPMNTYVQSGAIRITPTAAVVVSWSQYLRYCCSISNDLVLEVSTDSINWITYDANKGRSASTTGPNGERMRIDVSNSLRNVSRFWLRFRSTGNSHYFWMIDDVLVSEGISNGLSIESFSIDFHDSSNTFLPMYSIIPTGRSQSMISSLNTNITLKNTGSNPATGVRITMELYEDSICNNSRSPLGIVSSFSSAIGNISTGQSANLRINPTSTFIPSVVNNAGDYRLRITAISDSVNQTPLDAIREYSFTYADTSYAKDRGSYNQKFGPRSYIGGGNQGDFIGELYRISNGGGMTFSSISLYIPNDTAMVGVDISPRIYSFDKTKSTLDSAIGQLVASSPFRHTINTQMLGSRISFELFPWVFIGGGDYIVGIEQLSLTNSNRYLMVGWDTSVNDFSNSTSGYMFLNEPSNPRWILTNRNTSIRLNIPRWYKCNTTVSLNEKAMDYKIDIYPNPTSDFLNLDLGENRFQQLEIRNTLGALVYEQQILNPQLQMDVSHLEKGLYFVSLIGENSREVKKIIIQ